MVSPASLRANPPVASYIFPAGGQRGTTVNVRIGGLFLHEKCGFALDGTGLTASRQLVRTKPLWFEGPLLPLPESQQQEDYPADMAGTVAIAKDAPLGGRRGWLFTSQGGAGGLVFVVGELPEAIEKEADGEPIPQPVALPVTANGRIFPRDDIDLWEFEAAAGQTVTAMVLAQSLRSPLTPRLDILDPAGRVLAETMTHPVVGADESVRFTAPAAGKYRVRITDAKAQGGQAYVYRLTLTSAPVTEFEFPLKHQPDGLTDVLDPADVVQGSVALNGRIEKPGAIQEWKLNCIKGGRYALDMDAGRAGSPLCGVVTVSTAAGKELARAETDNPGLDPQFLSFVAPADGVYTVRVAERFRGRGGPNFVYRLRVYDFATRVSGFGLTVLSHGREPFVSDVVNLLRGRTVKVRVVLQRAGGGPVVVSAEGLPRGVTAKPITIPANEHGGELTLHADETAVVGAVPLVIVGTGTTQAPVAVLLGSAAAQAEKTVRVLATIAGTRNLPERPAPYLAVGVPTPFKIVDQFVMTSAPRGEVYRRKYRIERDPGFDGPIEVRLADRQARHLQGVTGPVLTVPPGQAEFEYPAYLPPWMELGRTCRVCVMAVGKLKDADGTEHAVSFSATGQNQQMIVVVGPGRLDVALDKQTVRVEPGGEVRVPVRITRDRDLSGPVRVEAVIPDHWKGVSAAAVTIPADKATGELVLKFAAGESGPFNMPLVVRATLETKATPVVAEAKLEVVN